MSQSLTLEELNQVLADADLLKTKAEVEAAYVKLAQEITAELAKEMPVVFSVMNGALVMAGHLLPMLRFPLEQGYMHATRYRGEVVGQADLQWQALPSVGIEGRTVLILDDIFDEGHTLAAVVRACEAQGAKKVYTAALVNKVHDRKTNELKMDFVGMDVIDRYVFGCGMDYRDYWRNLPEIYAVKGL